MILFQKETPPYGPGPVFAGSHRPAHGRAVFFESKTLFLQILIINHIKRRK
jgi:hypothetical protein